MLGAEREAAHGGHAKRRDFPRIRAGPASRALAGRRHNNNPLRGSLDASRLRGGVRLRRRLETGSAPRLRLGLRPLHQLLPPRAPVATGSTSPLRVATAAPGARFASHFTASACQQALPLSRPLAARRTGPALGAFGPFAGVRCRSLIGPARTRHAGARAAAPEHRKAARAARARYALRETETRFAPRWTLALRGGIGLRPRLETTASRLAGRFALAWRRPASPAPEKRLRASPSAWASTSSPVAPSAGCGRKKPRRLRCASRRRRLVLASRRASRRPPANRRFRSRGLWPLAGPALRSAPSAPSLAFAAALLSGRAERGTPAPAVRRLNTETRFARRWTLALCDGIGLRPCLETTASGLAGRVALAWRRPATPAPGKRLRASPLARAATSSPVAPFASVGRKKPRRLRCASRRRRLEPVP